MVPIRPFSVLRPSAARVRGFYSPRLGHGDPEEGTSTDGEISGLTRSIKEGAVVLNRLVAERSLMEDPEPTMLLHRHVREHLRVAGAVACVSADACETRLSPLCEPCPALSAMHASVVERIGAQVESMVIGFEHSEAVNELFEREMNDRPLFHVVADDGATHTLWRGRRTQEMVDAFAAVENAWVLEGGELLQPGGEALAWLVPLEHLRPRWATRVVDTHAEPLLQAVLDRHGERMDASCELDADAAEIRAGVLGDRWRVPLPPSVGDTGPVEATLDARLDAWWREAVGLDPSTSTQRLMGAASKASVRGRWSIRLPDPGMDRLRAILRAGLRLPARSVWVEPAIRSGLWMHRTTIKG